MDEEEGVSVQEIENFARKYTYEVFFSLVFILASFFSMMARSPMWSLYLAALGGVLGVWFPAKVEKGLRSIFQFAKKQQKVTLIVLGVVILVVAMFLPQVVFLSLGLVGGKGLYRFAMHGSSNGPKKGQ